MSLKLTVPAWLAGLIGWLAGFIQGQKAAKDRSDELAAEAEKTAEQKRAEAEALDHEELERETDRWRRKS